MRKGMKRWMQVLLACVLALVCMVTLPAQAQAATKYVETSEKAYTYDSSTGKYTLSSTITYKYNKKGLVTEIKLKYTDGYSSVTKYTYYSNGKMKTIKVYSEGALNSISKMTYDKKGRKKTDTETTYYTGTKETTKYTFTYSKDGKSAVEASSTGKGYSAKYTFYSNGNTKTIKSYWDGDLQTAYSYNKYGYVTKYTSYDTYENSATYISNYYGTVSTSKLKKNKVSSDVTTTAYTYCDAKNGKLKKTTETCTFYNESGKKVSSLSYTGKVQATYYTSGYRKGYLKTVPVNNCTYKYTADKTKKNVGVEKQYCNGELQTKTVYTWKKISY